MNTSPLPSTITASDARTNLYDLLDEVDTYLRRFVVTHRGQPKAIIIPLEDIESLEETAEILAIPGAMASIRKGAKQAKNKEGSRFVTSK